MIVSGILAFFAVVGALALALCGVGAFVAWRHRRKVRIYAARLVNAIRGFVRHWDDASSGSGERHFDHVAWPQIESLLAINRILDGKLTLPPTRRWAASPDFILRVIRHIEVEAPAAIVECSTGTSTVAIAASLRVFGRGGHVYALENHPEFADATRRELQIRGLSNFATVITAPLSERTYDGFDHGFHWYDFDPDDLPAEIDLLVIDGPFGGVNEHARYPAGPELFPRLTKAGHVFLDDASRDDERELPKMWRRMFPDLGVREHSAEKGAVELFFLNRKIEEFLPADFLRSRVAAE